MVKRIFGRWSEKRRFFDYRLKKVDRKADYVFGRDPLDSLSLMDIGGISKYHQVMVAFVLFGANHPL